MTTPDAVPPADAADAAEQAQEVVPAPPGSESAGGSDLPSEAPLEADAADAAEQAAEVPIDEDEAPS
jgi:hypothetical protein